MCSDADTDNKATCGLSGVIRAQAFIRPQAMHMHCCYDSLAPHKPRWLALKALSGLPGVIRAHAFILSAY
jgi:hypothetical protein